MPNLSFAELDKATGFSDKAGFVLADLQVQDIELAATWRVHLNAYEVGGGKTVIASAIALLRGAEKVLVIVPPILILPWVRWLNKVSSNVLQYQGTPAERAKFDLDAANWIVMSHAIFRTDFGKLYASLRRKRLEIIVDEAHAMKSVTSVLYRDITKLSKGNYLQMLTGTPTSKPIDAYSYIKLKTPEFYRSLGHFESVHVAERDFFKQPIKWKELELLRQRLDVKTIIRTKKEVHGYSNEPLFPDSSYPLSREHYQLYQKLVDEQLLLLPSGDKVDATTATRLYHQIQQLIVNLDYFSGDPTKRSATYDLLDFVIDSTSCPELGNSKLIVWTLYKRTSRSVLEYLNRKGIKSVGAYSEVDSQKSFDLFMFDEATRILVAQLASAGAGLNPQEVCSESLFLEPSTVPLLNTQAVGRVDRVGQKRKPVIRFGVAQGTIQESILRRLVSNQSLVSQVEGSKDALREILLGRM